MINELGVKNGREWTGGGTLTNLHSELLGEDRLSSSNQTEESRGIPNQKLHLIEVQVEIVHHCQNVRIFGVQIELLVIGREVILQWDREP